LFLETERKFNREFKLEAVEMVKGRGVLVNQGQALAQSIDH